MSNGHRYTESERKFMEEYVPGHSHREIKEAFTQKFGWDISLTQVKAYIHNNNLNTGRTGRFSKGHVPVNKGKKGQYSPGSEKTWFKKGHIPHNHRLVGSERVTKDGYMEIKVEEPNKWELKHRVIWEQENGEIPKDHIVIFKDGNKENVNINNLLLIKKSVNAVMNHTNLHEFKGEFKETATKIAELKITTNIKKRCEV